MKPNTTKMKQAAKAVGLAAAGATVGYVAGILTAPAAGEKTRQKIGQGVSEAAGNLKGRAGKALHDVKERLPKKTADDPSEIAGN